MHTEIQNSVCWINTIDYDAADQQLKATYDDVRNADGRLDNLYQAFSLRAHTIKPADDLYLAAMHHEHNSLPKRLSELLGTYVAVLVGCGYAYAHHSHNFTQLCEDRKHAIRILDALQAGDLDACGDEREVAALRYVRELTERPASITVDNINRLRNIGWDDGEILEIAQVAAMFSYFVRIINGVGISLDGDRIGLY